MSSAFSVLVSSELVSSVLVSSELVSSELVSIVYSVYLCLASELMSIVRKLIRDTSTGCTVQAPDQISPGSRTILLQVPVHCCEL